MLDVVMLRATLLLWPVLHFGARAAMRDGCVVLAR
jgi:hypothetical protein